MPVFEMELAPAPDSRMVIPENAFLPLPLSAPEAEPVVGPLSRRFELAAESVLAESLSFTKLVLERPGLLYPSQ